MYEIRFETEKLQESLSVTSKDRLRGEFRGYVKTFLERGGRIQQVDYGYSAFDGVKNRSKVLTEKDRKRIKSLRRGSKNGNAARLRND